MTAMKLFRKITSGDLARDRLKLLLVADRVNCSPDMLELIKADMVQAISKYIEVDPEGLELQIGQTRTEEGICPALSANIPIRSVKQYNRQTI
ncbi:MAG: cell division topological specificity factor MinE [Clostridiales bacterium]|nr:cell division topological specificity factor MinE [Clostridiales bacterium]